MTSQPILTYVGDPLCSWCWGFAPSLRELRSRYPHQLRYELVVGGLRTGASAALLDDALREYLRNAWREVERRSGQPFSHRFLERADFVYDTGPACRAVVAARSLSPESVFDYNEALQQSFYQRGLDPTTLSTFRTVAREQGLPADEFERRMLSVASDQETQSDFDRARALGAHGFPTVLIQANGRTEIVTRGWVPPDTLLAQLRPWLDP